MVLTPGEGRSTAPHCAAPPSTVSSQCLFEISCSTYKENLALCLGPDFWVQESLVLICRNWDIREPPFPHPVDFVDRKSKVGLYLMS